MFLMDLRKKAGRRILDVKIGGVPVSPSRRYTLTHNSFCTRPKNMKRYLNLSPGSVKWKNTGLMDYEVLTNYARHLKVIDYKSRCEVRIEIKR